MTVYREAVWMIGLLSAIMSIVCYRLYLEVKPTRIHLPTQISEKDNARGLQGGTPQIKGVMVYNPKNPSELEISKAMLMHYWFNAAVLRNVCPSITTT